MGETGELVLRVFTHPACGGCGTAVREAWALGEQHPRVEVRTVSLERKEGLAEARREGVQTIPTLILDRAGEELERWIGSPEPGALTAAMEHLETPNAEREAAGSR